MAQKRIQKWIERIPRHIQEILKPEVNGGNNYKKGREDFDFRRGTWKGFRTKGNLSARVDMGTDLLSIEAANQSEQEIWEELMSDAALSTYQINQIWS